MVSRFQQGGQALDILTQVIGGLIQDPETTIQKLSEAELSQPGTLKLIYTAIGQMAEQGSLEAALAKEILDLAMNQLAQSARHGAKLNYIKRLQGICPEGYTTQYFKIGGRIYSQMVPMARCGSKMKKVQKDCGGRKVVRGAEGFIADQLKKNNKTTTPVGGQTKTDVNKAQAARKERAAIIKLAGGVNKLNKQQQLRVAKLNNIITTSGYED